MRIISGIARGRKLTPPPLKDTSIRPTADRAREALFSIISHRIPNCHILDLFAGTGAFGLEAMSRGAKSITFVDNSKVSIDLINRNASLCFSSASHIDASSIKIIKHDLTRDIRFTGKSTDLTQYDIIFLDPPYSKNIAVNILEQLGKSRVIKKEALIIAEERSNQPLPGQIEGLDHIDTRRYGETQFWFFTCQS